MQSAKNWQVSILLSIFMYSNRCSVQYLFKVDRLPNMSWFTLIHYWKILVDHNKSFVFSVYSTFSPLGHQSIDNTLGALVCECLCCWTGGATGAFLTCLHFSFRWYVRAVIKAARKCRLHMHQMCWTLSCRMEDGAGEAASGLRSSSPHCLAQLPHILPSVALQTGLTPIILTFLFVVFS